MGRSEQRLFDEQDAIGHFLWVGGPEDLKELLAMSDHVILALPVTTESKNIIDVDALSAMKKEAFMISS